MSSKTGPFHRRTVLKGLGSSALFTAAAPSILRAQVRELVIGGAASHKPWVETHVAPIFEKKYNAKINFEGTRSLVNLEKMQKNKDQAVSCRSSRWTIRS